MQCTRRSWKINLNSPFFWQQWKTGAGAEYKSIAKDMLAYKASGKRPKNWDFPMDTLESIPAINVESQRIFSITGKLLTKQRGRISNKCFMRLFS